MKPTFPICDPPCHPLVFLYLSGLAFLEQSAESRLVLPEFPSLDGVEFTLPPLPRLIPSWEQLHSIQPPPHPRVGGGLELQPAALGAGLGALAIALAAGWRGSIRRKRRKRVGGSLVKS